MIRLQATEAQMGNTKYYVTTMGLGEVARHVKYRETPDDWPPELLTQRKLNSGRVKKEMVPYLLNNPDHFYGALVVEHVRHGEPTHEVRFKKENDDGSGWIELDGTETLEVGDGQHRLSSIKIAVEQRPELARERIAVIILPHRNLKHTQQLFSDLNRHAKPTPKSLNILFEHREEEAILARDVARESRYLSKRVGFTGSNLSLSSKSPYFVTLSTFYGCTCALADAISAELTTREERKSFMLHVWDDVVFPSLPDMALLQDGRLKPADLRSRYLFATMLGIECLAEAAAAAIQQFPTKWELILKQGLSQIKWDLADPAWEGIAISAGRLVVARAPRRRTATLIKHLLGLMAPEEHVRDLQTAMWRMGNQDVGAPLPAVDLLPKLQTPLVIPTEL